MYEVWGEGGPYHGGGVATRDTEPYIHYIIIYVIKYDNIYTYIYIHTLNPTNLFLKGVELLFWGSNLP